MPFAGLGLHILLAIFCAVHALRTGQPLYWLIILFSFPLLGSVVYFVAIYLPNSRLQHGTRRAVAVAARVIDPTRDVREARADFEETPTAQNQMRLAAALLETGESEQAARLYEACLKGPFASDLEIRYGAARAFSECQRHAEGLAHLQAIRQSNADFRAEAVSLLIARCHAGLSHTAEARSEFEAAVARFGTFETLAEYTIWALGTGDQNTSVRLQAEIDRITQRWSAHNRQLNAVTLLRLKVAQQRSASLGQPAT